MSIQFETRTEASRRKFPRLFLLKQNDSALMRQALRDVSLVWSDQTASALFDVSESGLLVSAEKLSTQIKIGQTLEVKLRLRGLDLKVLQVKVLRLTKGMVLLALDGLTVAGRLKLEQEFRESMIRSSWQELPATDLGSYFQGAKWIHSVFDSNIWIWQDSVGVLEKLIVEFESVAFVYDPAGSRFLKTPSAFDESKGYAGPFVDPLPHKVEPGHNWVDRLLKNIEPNAVITEQIFAEIRRFVMRSNSKQIHV